MTRAIIHEITQPTTPSRWGIVWDGRVCKASTYPDFSYPTFERAVRSATECGASEVVEGAPVAMDQITVMRRLESTWPSPNMSGK